MKTRSHIHEESFEAPPERVFDILVTPSAIRQWWGASSVVVLPRSGGVWVAAWGAEDDPDYITMATLVEYDRPRRLVMKYGEYYAKSGALPFKFEADAVTIFTIEPDGQGSRLKVEQTGFPADSAADSFYNACETGWKTTFQGIRNFLSRRADSKAV